MPRAQIRFQAIRLDGNFTKKVDESLKVLTRQAAREWLRTMAVSVPVWTGQALGSIKFSRGPYGTLARYLNVSIPIHPKEIKKGKNAETGGEQGRYNFTFSNKNYRFYFRSDVPHYIHNDFFPRTDGGRFNQQIQAPWHSLEKASDAFNRYVKENISSVPRISSALIKHKLGF